MPKIVEVEIEVGSKAALGSINELRKAATQLEEKLATATFGTPEFQRLSNQLKTVRNQFKDIDASLEGLDKEQRAAALVDTFNGLTGAVGAVSSAFIAFGADSAAIEDAEKKLLGIIGVVNGLRDVSNSLVAVNKLTGFSFEKLGESIKTSFQQGSFAANSFKVALAGLGIGVVIAAVSKFIEVLNEEDKVLAANKEAVDASAKSYEGFAATVVAANDAIARTADLAVAQAELEGKSAAEITKIQKDALNDQLFNTAQQLDLLTKERDKNRKDAINIAISEDKTKDDLAKKRLRAEKAYDDETKKQSDALNKILYDGDIKYQLLDIQLKKKTKDENNKIAAESKKNLLDTQAALNESLRKLDEVRATEGADAINTQYANDLARLKEARDKELEQENVSEEAKANIRKKFSADVQILEANRSKALIQLSKETTDKIRAQQQQQLDNQLTDIDDYYNRLLSNIDNTASQIALTQGIATKEQFDNITTFIQQAINDTQEALKKQNEDVKTSTRARIDLTVRLLEEEQLKRQAILQQQTDNAIANFGIFSEEARVAQQKQNEDFQRFQTEKTKIITQGSKELLAIDEATTQKQAENRKKLDDLVIDSASSLIGDLQSLNQIYDQSNEEAAKKAFERGQALAVAQTIIETYSAASKAYASQIIIGDPTSIVRAQIAAGVAIAGGLARLAVIKSQKFDGNNASGSAGGSGSGGSVSGASNAGGSSVLNPFGGNQGFGSTNVLPPRLAPPSGGGGRFGETTGTDTGGVNTPVVRAYVLAGDVTDAQVADTKINQKRKF